MTEGEATTASRRRLAIIGGGSSGLISLKYAIDFLPDWDVVCYEMSDRTTGCWGNPYPGFVSTSTKYTTQFACFPIFDAAMNPDGGACREEFFRDDEYGQYLERFATAFGLQSHILLRHRIDSLMHDSGRWRLAITQLENGQQHNETFDAVIVCTGLAARPKQIAFDKRQLSVDELINSDDLGHITNKTIVVIGGGESGVDFANRLSRPELNNRVFLSLQSGIRVSPRYHPIRGVPSDFLRNRLMLSIHEDMRNWIGDKFVKLRIRYENTFRRLFPQRGGGDVPNERVHQLRKEWAFKLTKAAKDELFNMFHNKSDDFLNAVADGRLAIVGPPADEQMLRFRQFDSGDETTIAPDLIVPAIGYHSTLEQLSTGELTLGDFYLGCCHIEQANLCLVGFARPIIGNIPSISEMQAQFVCGLMAGNFERPPDIARLHERDQKRRELRYQKLNQDAVYPVEMFPYCDVLAKAMGILPDRESVGSFMEWWRMQVAPASTLHYHFGDDAARNRYESAPTYMPWSLIALLLALKPLDWIYRRFVA